MRRDQPLMNVDLFLNEITLSGWADVACRTTVHELPVGLTSLYIRIPKTPRTEHGKNDLRFCQRTTASGDCRLRPAEAERSWFGNTIFGWAVRVYVSMRKTRTKSITASLRSWGGGSLTRPMNLSRSKCTSGCGWRITNPAE